MEHQCLTSLLRPVSPRVSVVPDGGTSGGLSEGRHEPSPEEGIGCKELKTRTPGRGDSSPRGPASPAEESHASGATGGRRAHHGGMAGSGLRDRPSSDHGPPCSSDVLTHSSALAPTPATALLTPVAPARGLAAMVKLQRNSG
uniref:Uncharacterized protein n=1 Tax=Rangifer tarandus platyrhynchus TaxID=3082113 RepID=A0ACB0FNF1_RANTA|nr:unnamed protein product [Rangifer tarandus platyrhynchus]